MCLCCLLYTSTILARIGLAVSERKMAVNRPIGTPITIAPKVPAIAERIIGRTPKTSALASHFVPNRKSPTPISIKAGAPETRI